jgi:hypothetical protein
MSTFNTLSSFEMLPPSPTLPPAYTALVEETLTALQEILKSPTPPNPLSLSELFPQWETLFPQCTQLFTELLPALKAGIPHTLPNGKEVLLFHPSKEDLSYFEDILALTAKENALVPLSLPHLQALAEKHLALCVIDPSTNTCVAFQGTENLSPEEVQVRNVSPYPFCEIRSAVTHPDFRKQGLNSLMKPLQCLAISGVYQLIVTGFTDDIPGTSTLPPIKSTSISLLQKLHFSAFPVSTLPEPLKFSLTKDCPPGRCGLRDGGTCPCACTYWALHPDTFSPLFT